MTGTRAIFAQNSAHEFRTREVLSPDLVFDSAKILLVLLFAHKPHHFRAPFLFVSSVKTRPASAALLCSHVNLVPGKEAAAHSLSDKQLPEKIRKFPAS